MDYLIVLVLCVLATAKVSFQTAFSKQMVKKTVDALVYNGFAFLFSAILFLPKVFGCSPAVWVYASISAMFTVMFQLFYTKALTMGNVSLTVLIVNFSMVINVIVSYLFFGEPISFLRLCGIVITVLSFVVCTNFYESKGNHRLWLLMTVLSMITTSGGSIVQKFFGESQYKAESAAFVSCLYIVAALVVLVVYSVMHGRGERITYKLNFNSLKYAAAVGIILAVYQNMYTRVMGTIDGTFLFPAQTGGVIILTTLAGVLIFKDRLDKRQILGMLMGMVSIVLMNF